MSDTVGQCRVDSHDWGDEEETWGPNGEKGSSAYWELIFETRAVDDSGAIKKVTFYPSPIEARKKTNVDVLSVQCSSRNGRVCEYHCVSLVTLRTRWMDRDATYCSRDSSCQDNVHYMLVIVLIHEIKLLRVL